MQSLIQIKDRQFRPMISEGRIAEAVERIAATLNREMKDDFPIFLVVLNGSFIFAADLLRRVHIPLEVSFIKLASYQGMESSGSVKEIIGMDCLVQDRNVVVLEDIVDSGLTIENLCETLRTLNAKKLSVVTLLFKPHKFKGSQRPDHVGFEVGDDFVVGYGMDYAGQGRNLKEVHVLA